MKHFSRIDCWLGFAAVLTLAPLLLAQAANPQDSSPNTGPPPAIVRTTHQILVTGCLKRGNQPGTYVITDQNGTTWELVSGSADLDLSKHIFHAVSIAGKEVRTSPQSESPKQSLQANNPLHELRVLTLQVLSPSCTR